VTTPFGGQRRIEDLERRAASAERILAALNREPVSPQRRWVYLAKTARESVYYPDGDANTYPIIFLDRESADAEGERAATDRELSIDPRAYGRTVNGQPLLEDEVCYAFPMPKPRRDDKCRWILEPLTKIYWGNLNEPLTPGGSAEVRVYTPAGDGPDDWIDSGEDRTVHEVLLPDGSQAIPEETRIGFVWYFDRFVMIGGAAPPTGIPFRNDSGETVPAYGVMRVTGSVTVDGTEYVTIGKPNSDFKRKYLVNTGSDVANGAYGTGTWLDEGGSVLYDDANTPAIGESWGPSNGSWKIKKWRYGFSIIGNPTGGSTDLVRAWQEEVNEFIGKTDSTHNKNSTGTVSIYDGNLADTTDNMSSVENKFANVSSSKWVQVRWNAGKWHLVAAEC
jgi:hypothetical protein